MAILVSTVRTALGERLKDITDVSNDLLERWCDFANKRAYNFLINVDPTRFFLTQNFVVSTRPQTSALPATFKSIEPEGSGFFLQNADGVQTDTRLTRTNFGSGTQGYYIDGTNVVFTGMDAGDTWVLRYVREPVTIDEQTDFFTVDTLTGGVEIVPDEYLEFLLEDLVVLYHRWDENPGDESLADFRFARLTAELGSNIRREPHAYAVPDYSVNY